MDSVIADSDYISVHVPLNDNTKGLFNKDKFKIMKGNVRLLNFARGGLVNNEDLKQAIADGKIAAYVTDFPDEDLIKMDNVIAIPHLGASTAEAEENCALMAAEQLKDFLETGNIKNSVNFPNCGMEFNSRSRILITNKNVPSIIGQITSLLAADGVNISEYLNKHKNDYAYNIIDVETEIPENIIDKLKSIDGIISVRIINK